MVFAFRIACVVHREAQMSDLLHEYRKPTIFRTLQFERHKAKPCRAMVSYDENGWETIEPYDQERCAAGKYDVLDEAVQIEMHCIYDLCPINTGDIYWRCEELVLCDRCYKEMLEKSARFERQSEEQALRRQKKRKQKR